MRKLSCLLNVQNKNPKNFYKELIFQNKYAIIIVTFTANGAYFRLISLRSSVRVRPLCLHDVAQLGERSYSSVIKVSVTNTGSYSNLFPLKVPSAKSKFFLERIERLGNSVFNSKI